MEVSVIIVNYNTFDLTCLSIQSVIEKTNGLTYEIIVVDNASDEISPQEFKNKFPEIQLIVNSANEGFAKGNNLGIVRATGEYIILLNSDAMLKNNAIAICRNSLQQHPSVGAMAARLEYPDGRIQHNCQRFPSIKYKLIELLRLQKIISKKRGGRLLLGPFFDYNDFIYVDWIWGTFFMFPRSILKQMPEHRLPDEFFMYGEDVQWCMEFNKLGYLIAFNPTSHVIHYMGKSGGAKSELMKSNMDTIMRKYYSFFNRKIIDWLDWLLIKDAA